MDLCPNLVGNQATVPPGYELVNGDCQVIPPPDVPVAPYFTETAATCDSGETVVVQDTEAIHYTVNYEGTASAIVDAQAQPGYDLIATNEPGGWYYLPADEVDRARALATLAPALDCPDPASCEWTKRTIPGYPDYELKAWATGLSTTEVSRLTVYLDGVSIFTQTYLAFGRVGNEDGTGGVALDHAPPTRVLAPGVYTATWTINTTGAVQATCSYTVT